MVREVEPWQACNSINIVLLKLEHSRLYDTESKHLFVSFLSKAYRQSNLSSSIMCIITPPHTISMEVPFCIIKCNDLIFELIGLAFQALSRCSSGYSFDFTHHTSHGDAYTSSIGYEGLLLIVVLTVIFEQYLCLAFNTESYSIWWIHEHITLHFIHQQLPLITCETG